MEKTISITLNGLIFNIEEEAYIKLDNYLESIREYYGGEESKEILGDIESSIADKFFKKNKGIKKVITEKDVEEIIKIMGTVEEFDAQDNSDSKTPGEEKKIKKDSAFNLGKRLYRNPDDIVIAGVCSGIASYFGIDPVFVRILFVVLTFVNGIGLLAYIIFWIVIPEAKSNSQKLEMEGEAVNIKKLEETIKSKAKAAKKEGQVAFNRIKSNKGTLYQIINFPIQIFRTAMQFLIKCLRLFWPTVRIFFGIIIVVAALAAILGLTIASGVMLFNINSPYIISDLPLDILINSPMYYIGVIAIYFLAVVPLIFLFILGLTMLRGRNCFRVLLSALLAIIWILAIATGVVVAGDLAPKIISRLDEQAVLENITRDYDYNNFDKLYLGANMEVKIKEGDEFNITMIGRQKDLDRLDFNIEDKQLQVVQKKANETGKICFFCFNKKIQAEITVPELKSFVSFQSLEAELDDFNDLVKLSIGESSKIKTNFSGGDLEIYVAGVHSNLEIIGSPDNINATLEGFGRLIANELATEKITINQGVFSRVYLKGETNELVAEVSRQSDLFAKDLKAKTAKIKTLGQARAEVYPLETLDAIAQDQSRIYYKGDPDITKKETSSGKIKELDDYDFDIISRENKTDDFKIIFKSNTYSPTMSSIRGIELEPSMKLGNAIQYDWTTNFGYLIDSWEEPIYIDSLINDGDKVYWTFLGDEGYQETSNPIFIYLKAKDKDGDIISQSKLELGWEDPGIVEVIR